MCLCFAGSGGQFLVGIIIIISISLIDAVFSWCP